jgi:hypothetical protein
VLPMKTLPLDIRRLLLRQHGNFALAYSVTFQPGLEHFGDEAGFLSYKTVGSTALVLSNCCAQQTQGFNQPVCGGKRGCLFLADIPARS